jgi:hypothetical protein
MNEEKLYQIRDKYNLSYHVDFLRECGNLFLDVLG